MACGVCGRRGLFRRWVHMEEQCPRCGLTFEREEGAFVGAVGINTIISFIFVALAVFFVLKAYNATKKAEEEADSGPSEIDLLTEIRDSLAKG